MDADDGLERAEQDRPRETLTRRTRVARGHGNVVVEAEVVDLRGPAFNWAWGGIVSMTSCAITTTVRREERGEREGHGGFNSPAARRVSAISLFGILSAN